MFMIVDLNASKPIELAHSRGHAKRFHRENFDNPVSFGSESHSKEELIAEMTAAMLCGIAGIEQRILELC